MNIDTIENSSLEKSYLNRTDIYGRGLAKVFYRHQGVYVHTRKSYNVLDIMEELGGISEIIFLFGALIIGPLAPFLFTLAAISKFYIVKRISQSKVKESEI